MIEIYFKFLNDYLTENLYKCINIFHDEANGITEQKIHEEFINYVLQPIRDKVQSTLSQNDLKTLIILISQIIFTDKNLSTSFHYTGKGLVSLLPDESWDKWLTYEIEATTKQFETITQNPVDLSKSADDFNKILKKTYEYLEPFYQLEYEPLETYKLKTCSQIFMKLSSSYLDYVLTTDSLGEKRTKEKELYQTIIKLQCLNIVYRKIYELSENPVFIRLTNMVNEIEGSNYFSVFQNILNDYQTDMVDDIQNSIIHRVKKLIKESLQNYFKLKTWSNLENPSENMESASSELVNTINLLNRVINSVDSRDIPSPIILNIKNELLNIIVNYFVESILKLNKFNQQGLSQFNIDFCSLRDTLNLPTNIINAKESNLLELLKVLTIRYDQKGETFLSKTYINAGAFDDLRKRLSLQHLDDSDIQDALYRIVYGNII